MIKGLFKGLSSRKRGIGRDPLDDYIARLCERIQSREQLKTSLEDATFCIIDLETTGLDLAQDVIINLAAVKIKKHKITKIFDAYTRPPFSVPVASIQWHGITDDMLRGKPSVAEILPEFLSFIGDSVIIGHHINFDLRMLSKHLQESYDTNLNNALWLDTMLLHRLVVENNTSTELDELLNIYCIDCDQRHRALGDSIATAKLFLRILKELQSLYKTVDDLYRAQQDLSRKENL